MNRSVPVTPPGTRAAGGDLPPPSRKRSGTCCATPASTSGQVGLRPCIHGARDTFAVTTLADWYREGADVQARLPLLSAWHGHADPRHTYWYYSDSRVIPKPAPLHA